MTTLVTLGPEGTCHERAVRAYMDFQGISDFDHPIFRFLKGRPDPIPLVTIGRYFPAEVRGRARHERCLVGR